MSDWSSDVCSSDLRIDRLIALQHADDALEYPTMLRAIEMLRAQEVDSVIGLRDQQQAADHRLLGFDRLRRQARDIRRLRLAINGHDRTRVVQGREVSRRGELRGTRIRTQKK